MKSLRHSEYVGFDTLISEAVAFEFETAEISAFELCFRPNFLLENFQVQ